MKTITVHGAWAANALSARSSERKSRVVVILDIDKGVKIHRRKLSQVNVVTDVFWFIRWILWVVLVNQKSFHCSLLLCSQRWIMLSNVVRIEISLHCWCHTFEKDWGFRCSFSRELPGVEFRQGFCYISDHLSKKYYKNWILFTNLQ